MINVTKTYLPPLEEYMMILKRAWDKSWITNNGELVIELEKELKNYLGVKNLLYCSNGTIVLQMALKALGITKQVITTPFSYVATTNVIIWENCTPVFVDIESNSCCINADKIEESVTEDTQAILATHVYGIPCDVDKIQKIASKYNLKVIYDAAHAFGVKYKGKSLLDFGDISTCSFHATKIFHTVEGGAIICNNDELYRKLYLYRQFGHIYDEYNDIGINAKNSEFHAAMGLAILPKIPEIIESRKRSCRYYDEFLDRKVFKLEINDENNHAYAYYPVIFKSEQLLSDIIRALQADEIFCRRYFFPSLNTLRFVKYQPCPISESISKRVLCLPLYFGMDKFIIKKICSIINSVV